ncbi:MAG: efflux RND transporter periplasmic adaptor subunit [Bacteroidia bacterium]|nr:efflux RND transporter periplasmic adaptor subunit [Bacteroidia bacterium]
MKYIIALTVMSLFFISCGEQQGAKENAAPAEELNMVHLNEAQIKSAGLRLGKIELKDIARRLTLNGKIDVPPQNLISVSMPMGGYLKTTHLLPGMHVKKGEVLATMEDQQYIQMQQDYLMARSKLAFLENEFKRQKELNQSKSSSDKVFQQTEMEYNNAKVSFGALAEKLKILNIRPEALTGENVSGSIQLYSPIDGFVSKVNVNIGKYVNPTDVLFELINPSDIHLNLKVFEKDLEHLAIGQKVLAYNNNQVDKKYACEIILISQNLNADRSAEVHCHFDEYHKSLFPGMYMNAEIEISNKKAMVLPEQAIVSYNARDYVFLSMANGQFEMLEVKKGGTQDKYIEVSSVDAKDLRNADVVMDGAYALLMQLKNRPEEE